MLRRHLALPALGLFLLAMAGCAASSADGTHVAEDDPADHGQVDGATEVSEPALGLATIDADGVVRHLDLLDGSVIDLGRVPMATAVAGDGRYVFATGPEGITVIDSGRWTWDHVDHFHYYRAEPRLVGEIPGKGPSTVATTNSSTTGSVGLFFAGTGEAVLLDTEALSEGDIVERFRLEVGPHDGMVIPVGSFALLTEARGGVAVSVAAYDQEGMPVPGVTAECADARGTVTTRVGAVIGCADGALLATAAGGAVHIEHIPYPEGATAPPARSFAGREGRPTVAGLAGDRGIWLLDTRARSWSLLTAPAALADVVAVDDEAGHVLALAADGRVLVLDGSTGEALAATEPLVADSLATGAGASRLIVDHQRAYVNAPAEQRLYEIDFNDAARIAREFATSTSPLFLAGTGR